MDAITAVTLSLIIVGLLLMLAGWTLVARKSKEDSSSMFLLGVLVPILPAWVISGFHYRDLKQEFWMQTTGALLIAGAGLFNLAMQ